MARHRKPRIKGVESTEAVYSEGTTRERRETVNKEQHVFTEEPAFVRASVGMTYNLGNYESLRVDAAITMPCLPDDVAQCHGKISELAYTLMQEELNKCLGTGEEGADE